MLASLQDFEYAGNVSLDPFGTLLIGLLSVALGVYGFADRSAGLGAAGGYWAWAWSAMLAVGFANALGAGHLARVLSTMGPALMLAGSLSYRGRPVPAWILPAALGVGVTRGALSAGDATRLAALLSLVMDAPLMLAAAWVVQQARGSEAGALLGRLIGVALVGLAAIEASEALSRLGFGAIYSPWIGWVVVGVPLGTLQLTASLYALRRLVHRSARELSESQERLRHLGEHAKDLISEISADGHVVYVSPNVRTVLGYEPEELVGRHVAEIASILQSSRIADLGDPYATVVELEARGPFGRISRLRHRDGRWRWFEVDANTYRANGDLRAISIARDVSDRMEAETALRASESMLRNAQRIARIGSWEWNLASGDVRWSDETYRILGLDPRRDGASIEAFLELLDAGERDRLIAALRSAVERRQLIDVKYRITLRSGEERVIHGRGEATSDASGKVVQLSGTSHDITDQVRATEQHQALEAKMQQAQKLESIGVLAGGIAHDFNNLLVGVLSNAELVLEELEPESAARASAEGIKQAGERAAELTNHLLAYAGKAAISLQTIDLGALVGEMSRLLATSLPKTTELRVELEQDTLWIHADSTQVRQVVMNLITNAGDALEGRPGVVTVRTGVTRLDRRDLADCYLADELDAGEYVFVEVCDTGDGIRAATLSDIFEPFFTTKFQGRGLGLAAATGIVRRHAGTIRVQSKPNRGTQFRVFLPRAAGGVGPGREAPAPSPWHGRGKALVVDDEEIVRTVSARALKKLGFSILIASSGAEALELFRKNDRDVAFVLLDLTMPVMDGEATFRALRNIRADVPVVFMSGHSSRDIGSRLLGKTQVGRLRKPFHLDELENTLRAVLRDDATA